MRLWRMLSTVRVSTEWSVEMWGFRTIRFWGELCRKREIATARGADLAMTGWRRGLVDKTIVRVDLQVGKRDRRR